MTDLNFTRWNKILGWLVFLISLTTYWLTVEPTVSFWDAGEYISTSSNLEVGHPPGAPLYQMLGAFFSIFASEASQIALMINLMSVFASAFTILFMFWSIVILVSKIAGKPQEITAGKKMAILGSALVGSLAFAFTDSFWFNAGEAEVYAMATFLMAVLFYLGLLWERDMFAPRGNRWVILISFIIGLSFGVHFMGLLTIPAIGFLYYFKNFSKITIKNFILANLVVVAVLMFIFKMLLPYSLKLFSATEVFFVNSLGLPFNSGTIFATVALIALFYFGIKYTRKKHYYQLNTLLLCILFIFIGFSSWMMLPIRANANTVINENNPNNARELLAYYNREQYPETHLFYGPQFTEIYSGLDANNPYIDDKPKYEKDEKKGKYVIVNDYENAKQNTDDNHKAVLPRMWSTEHAANYLDFTGPLDFTIKPEYQGEDQLIAAVNEFKQQYNRGEIDNQQYDTFLRQFREYIEVEKPSFASNINYLFEYQMGYMYWRYFMWNFVGRQDDVQGKYTDQHGNWLSGIEFIDEARLGSQDQLPSDVKNNRARNTYYFLPLILGLLGLVFQFTKDKKNFWVLLVFFLFTGIALKIYLNERPFEPRERDYALVGSFYVFAIWIGFGVYALFDMLKDYLKPKIAAPLVVIISLLAVPVLLASENWDDHDRSGRYTALAMAKMYLDSVDENAILFTIGDNDTFALWYAQQIEKYRTDVRVVNTSLFATDWYIDQMKHKAWESDPIPGQLVHSQYSYGTNDAVWYQPITKDTMMIKNWVNWIASSDPRTKAELMSGQFVSTFPTKNIRIPVNKENVLENGIVKPENADEIVDHIDIELTGDILYKNRLLMLDIIANNEWERPIYFTGGSFGDDDYLWMKDYLQLDGVTYKLVPIRTPVNRNNPFDMGRIDSDKMYDIVMGWYWGKSGDPSVYHDPETRKNAITYRSNLARLVEVLIQEGKLEKAEDVLDLAMEKMPVDLFEYYTLLEPFISGYYEVGEKQKARDLWEDVAEKYQENLTYYSTLDLDRQYNRGSEIVTDIERYRSLVDLLIINDDQELAKEKASEFNNYLMLFKHFYGSSEAPEDLAPDLQEEMVPEEVVDTLN
ncbi:protein O-mannosyl-transferase family [Salinimicrobium flavum]|uniref:Protein O-mannosyl-transferase family n=1 Tax=Salinimicrobium flavum TaxID=1737065 RepID=A0ABW5IW19_9FLAO